MPESALDTQRYISLKPPPQHERSFVCTEVELLCGSSSRGTGFKKVRKDKRESNSRGQLEDPPHKLKEERPSTGWLSISRQPSSSFAPGSWRQATCNLRDEGGQATLRLYIEEHLHYSIHVNASFAPYIRIVDPSIHSRRHVLAIYNHISTNTAASSSSTTSASTTTCEPVYLAFRSRDTLNSWFVLLRSFAYPDIRPVPYPVDCAFPQNITYRVWRQLQITIYGGRKFANSHIFGPGYSDGSNSRDCGEKSSDRWEGTLEIFLNGIVVGRTGFKTLPEPAWSAERFIVTDPLMGGGIWAGSDGVENINSPGASPSSSWGSGPQDAARTLLEVRAMRSKSGLFTGAATVSHLSTAPIDLGPFRRGEAVKAWWPGFSQVVNEQDGELDMEIKFDEEIVLPLELYGVMKDILVQRNYFKFWQEITSRIPIPTPIWTHLVSLALYHGTLGPQLSTLVHAEVHDTGTSPTTLFRGNSLLTRVVECAMGILGAHGFLENSIGRIVREICRNRVTFESSVGGTGGANTTTGVVDGADLMVYWLQKMWDSIWGARHECPTELRYLFHQIRTQVEIRWGSSALHADLKYQGISAFLFLRFFTPALLRPDQHGLVVGPPPDGVDKTLKTLAKALQSLANLTVNQREEFTRSTNSFNEENVDAMIDYLTFVSTLSSQRPIVHSVPPSLSSGHSQPPQAHVGISGDPSPELRIRTALQARLPSMSALDRESLPVLPYMTDEARDFAVIASAVVRNARTPNGLVQPLNREIGPMNEALEGLTDGGLGVSNADVGDEHNSEPTDATGSSGQEVQKDVVRFIKACFDVQAEAMRRASPNGTALKKHGRRRRRPTKQDGNPNPDPPEQPMPVRTPSVEESVYGGVEFGVVSSSISTPGAGINAGPGSKAPDFMSSLSVDSSTRPDIFRQPSQNTMSDTKKSKIMRIFGSGRK
ncbi:unnamed protein product [Rhizoctonia solani]|uniref:Ras-GAP domain-containing protein n=1 Tax=Rhizoctonia solani TaxID=456999 RepID=A0A8H2XJS5_9AGAM|nr:unnamed protein product [Rhizoctonia solani]